MRGTRSERQKGARAIGLQLEVWAQGAPRLQVYSYKVQSKDNVGRNGMHDHQSLLEKALEKHFLEMLDHLLCGVHAGANNVFENNSTCWDFGSMSSLQQH